jgi:hypothetical protein
MFDQLFLGKSPADSLILELQTARQILRRKLQAKAMVE